MSSGDPHPPHVQHSRDFTSTRWSVVIAAGRDSSPGAKQALESLCETYWYPLYAYVRRRVSDIHEAHDLTQAFFAELLEKDYVQAANPDRGRFRSFLLTAFKHFLSKHWDRARTQKRGGATSLISLDFNSADSNLRIDPGGAISADQFYDQQWAIALLTRIMERLEAEFVQQGKSRQFVELKGFLIGDHAGRTFAQVADSLKTTESAAKKAASRMRQRYRELLRDEISQTVSEPEDVEDEMRKLFATLSLS
jgi:RNA polymerase sigma-70 factor (ECF subfamily)